MSDAAGESKHQQETAMRYRWQFWNNGYKKEAILHLELRPPVMGHQYGDRREDAEGAAVRKTLEDIPGVEHIESRHYAVHIRKASVFEWDEIKPAVLRVIRDYLDVSDLTELPELPETKTV